jgi:hypothetical protein
MHYTSALTGFRGLGTPVMVGAALVGLGRCDEADGQHDEARRAYDEALALGRETSEGAVTAAALEGLARLAATGGETGNSEALVAEARDVRATAHRPAPPHEARDLP